MANEVRLRDVQEGDLAVFFEQQRDPVACHMAAFTAKDPADREAFAAHWARIRGDRDVTVRTILFDGRVAGHVASFVGPAGEREVTYWVGREHWGRGVATAALARFLGEASERPILARAAADNAASIRVLEKCGFRVAGRGRFFANARGAEVEEVILKLEACAGAAPGS